VPILCDEDGQPGDLERAVTASKTIVKQPALPGDRNTAHAASAREAMYEGLARLRRQPEPGLDAAAEGEVA